MGMEAMACPPLPAQHALCDAVLSACICGMRSCLTAVPAVPLVCSFRVLNLHQDVRFALLRNGLEHPTLVARSAVIRARADAPLRGHLSLTGCEGEMAVQWSTGHGAAARGTVRWGTSPGRHSHAAPSRTSTYTRADMCGPPASTVGWVDPGTLHYAVMTGLAPATRYYYVYGTGEEAGGGSDGTWSREASFVTAPGRGGATGAAGPPGSGATPSSPSSSVTLLALADVGVADLDASFATTAMGASLATMSALSQELDAQLVVINGDVSYAQGYGASWAAFWDAWEPLFSRAPLMTTTGNHERDWPHTGDRFPEQYDSGEFGWRAPARLLCGGSGGVEIKGGGVWSGPWWGRGPCCERC